MATEEPVPNSSRPWLPLPFWSSQFTAGSFSYFSSLSFFFHAVALPAPKSRRLRLAEIGNGDDEAITFNA